MCQEKFARNYELKQHLKTAHAEETIVDSEKSDSEDVCAEEENNTVIRTETNNPEEEMKPVLQGQSWQPGFFELALRDINIQVRFF